jgi:hypothetical protein
MLPGAHWWALREKFKQSIPGVVTDSYLAATLNMQAKSARANVLPYLADIGLIDKEGKTQDLAKAWRDDEQYANVCKTIRETVYPEELLLAAQNPTVDRAPAERWFGNHTGAGSSAVRRMVQFYTILVEADVAKRKQEVTANGKTTPKRPPRVSEQTSAKKAEQKKPVAQETPATSTSATGQQQAVMQAPGVCINLQIHISSDSTPDQIDKIFESMAKHIYKK